MPMDSLITFFNLFFINAPALLIPLIISDIQHIVYDVINYLKK